MHEIRYPRLPMSHLWRREWERMKIIGGRGNKEICEGRKVGLSINEENPFHPRMRGIGEMSINREEIDHLEEEEWREILRNKK